MDFMKWLNSLGELLYEVMSWIVFFPVTLWRTVTRPISMMVYAEAQLAAPAEAQYEEALSPPLFLALAMLVSHAAAVALGEADALVRNQHGLAGVIKDDTSALALRVLLFAAFPLVMSVLSLRTRGLTLARTSLRPVFHAQCYPAAAFALSLSLGVAIGTRPGAGQAEHLAGGGLALAAFGYYLVVESRWFSTVFGEAPLRGFLAAVAGLVACLVIVFGVGLLFTR